MNLYIHVPFCASRCTYCDFYTLTGKGLRQSFVPALLAELRLRRDELPEGESIEHIYFGGGTPSQLSIEARSSQPSQKNTLLTSPMRSPSSVTLTI